MSATPNRRRLARSVVAGLLSLVVLAGCTTHQKDASNYGDTEDEFMKGCVTLAGDDNDVEGSTKISSPQDYCTCVFKAIEENVPFDEFKSINSDLRDNGGPLPASFVKAYDSCTPGES